MAATTGVTPLAALLSIDALADDGDLRRRHGDRARLVEAEHVVAVVLLDGLDVAGELRNSWVFVPAQGRPPLEPGEYYHHQLIGLRVKTDSGQVLGVVKDILETGANDILVVRPESGPEILIPVVDEFVLAYDLGQGEITVRLLPGLISD